MAKQTPAEPVSSLYVNLDGKAAKQLKQLKLGQEVTLTVSGKVSSLSEGALSVSGYNVKLKKKTPIEDLIEDD